MPHISYGAKSHVMCFNQNEVVCLFQSKICLSHNIPIGNIGCFFSLSNNLTQKVYENDVLECSMVFIIPHVLSFSICNLSSNSKL